MLVRFLLLFALLSALVRVFRGVASFFQPSARNRTRSRPSGSGEPTGSDGNQEAQHVPGVHSEDVIDVPYEELP